MILFVTADVVIYTLCKLKESAFYDSIRKFVSLSKKPLIFIFFTIFVIPNIILHKRINEKQVTTVAIIIQPSVKIAKVRDIRINHISLISYIFILANIGLIVSITLCKIRELSEGSKKKIIYAKITLLSEHLAFFLLVIVEIVL